MHRHNLAPPGPFRAAPALARLIAAGLLDYPECLAALAEAGDATETPSGRRTRLAHALTDAVAHWAARRAHAARTIPGGRWRGLAMCCGTIMKISPRQ